MTVKKYSKYAKQKIKSELEKLSSLEDDGELSLEDFC